MQIADAPSEPGAVLRVGRDKSVCRLRRSPDDWLFVSRVHLEFRCGSRTARGNADLAAGSQPDPSSEVRLTVGGHPQPPALLAVPCRCRGAAAESPGSRDRAEPRSVNVGYYHEM